MNSFSSRHFAQTWPYPRHKTFEDQLQKSNAGWFAERKLPVNKRMPYLLEHWDDWPKNIILAEVAGYIKEEQSRRNLEHKGFPLHKYIHHGLSSQAMLFNLIGPLIIQNNYSPLRAAFEAAEVQWPDGDVLASFEVENRSIFNEDSGQPTSIDLMIKGSNDARSLFIEAKLVEREFGGCSVFQGGDCDGSNPVKNFGGCYLHHLGRRYWTLLENYGFLSGRMGESPICPFASYYQFFRELLFAIESGGNFVLLYDQRNPTFFKYGPSGERGLMPFLKTFVPENMQDRFLAITIQQIIEAYRPFDFTWLLEFEKKYALV